MGEQRGRERTEVRYTRTSDTVVRRGVLGETFLVPVRGHIAELQELFLVNEVGGSVWERLEQPATLESLVGGVVADFEVGEDQARKDVQTFLQQLLDAGLAEVDDEAESRDD